MAQLKDLIVTGPARVVGTLYAQAATQSVAGLMTTADKTKLDGIAASANNYSHPNSGATAGSYGPSANASPAHSGTFSVPYITINAAGHVTAASTKTITLPAIYSHPTTSGNKHIPSGGSSGQILRWSADGTATWGADNNTTYSAGTGLSLSSTTFNHSNSVTAGTAGTSSATSGSTLAVPYVTYDAQGHITATGTHTHTISGFLTAHQTIKQDGVTGATVNRYGACSIAAGTAAKTVALTGGTFSLEAGARVTVKFNNANTASTPTLNVASTGAKNIFHKGAQITTGGNKALLAGICDFVYDGTQYHLVGNYIDTNTNTTYTANTTSIGSASAGTAFTVPNISVTATTVATGAKSTANCLTGVAANGTASVVTGVAANGTATCLTGVKVSSTGSCAGAVSMSGCTLTIAGNVSAATAVAANGTATALTGVKASGTATCLTGVKANGTAAAITELNTTSVGSASAGTAFTIPNISVTAKTVATGITAA